MTKNYITYMVGGVALGLVLGFLVANWTSGSGPEAAVARKGELASVNSGARQLPPGHPDVGNRQADPAGQLPPGHPDIGGGSSSPDQAQNRTPAASTPIDLPSLDPLPAGSKEERAEQKYKNIQMLKGLPADRLMNVMMAFKSALGVDCTYCHIKDQWEKDDKQTKQIARKMIQMTRENNSRLGGIGRVSCYTCHRGQTRPVS